MASSAINKNDVDINAETENKIYSGEYNIFDLDVCVKWILNNHYSKVCLQFPESLLVDSVDIAAYVESQTSQKVFILGDTAYGSCCVDEVACQHVNADAVIHFGHACLSPVSKLPVFYIFPKREFSVDLFITRFSELKPSLPCLILYDVSYNHKIEILRSRLLSDNEKVCVSDLVHKRELVRCSYWCSLSKNKSHEAVKFRRGFCHAKEPFSSVVYIGPEANPNFNNFCITFKDLNFYQYNNEEGLKISTTQDVMKKVSYLVEKVKDAENVGIIVATLGIVGYREAIDHIKTLCKRRGKRVYILSIGKPTPAKLANFPEIDIFVAISCPEANWGDKRMFLQPIVGLFEIDLALNEARPWSTVYSKDFTDVIAEEAERGGSEKELESEQPGVSRVPSKTLDSSLGENKEADKESRASRVAQVTEKSLSHTQEKETSLVLPVTVSSRAVQTEPWDRSTGDLHTSAYPLKPLTAQDSPTLYKFYLQTDSSKKIISPQNTPLVSNEVLNKPTSLTTTEKSIEKDVWISSLPSLPHEKVKFGETSLASKSETQLSSNLKIIATEVTMGQFFSRTTDQTTPKNVGGSEANTQVFPPGKRS